MGAGRACRAGGAAPRTREVASGECRAAPRYRGVTSGVWPGSAGLVV